MKLLDLFAGAGGAGVGYARAGFDVYAVDVEDHPSSPHPMFVGDALAAVRRLLDGQELRFGDTWLGLGDFAAVHASPPCQSYSTMRHIRGGSAAPLLVPDVRALLRATGLPYVIENVPGAPLLRDDAFTLCGSMFGLGAICRDGAYRQLRRHRLFEAPGIWVMTPECAHKGEPVGVYGGGGGRQTRGYAGFKAEASAAMGIDWMNWLDLAQAIPPAYTEHIGEALLAQRCRPGVVGTHAVA